MSLSKVLLENAAKKKSRVENEKILCLKGNAENENKHNYNTAFSIAYMIKHFRKSHSEDHIQKITSIHFDLHKFAAFKRSQEI